MTAVAGSQPRLTITNRCLGDRVTFLQRTDGQGSPTVIEIELLPSGGNAAHVHRSFDEHFTCLSGTLGLEVGGRKLYLKSGEQATARSGVPHRFFNPGTELVSFRVELRPGHAGFERGLIVAYGLANDGLTTQGGVPRNPLHLAVLCEIGEAGLPGPMGLLQPLLNLLAARARRLGVDRELIARYGA
ncbi:mannose-6-phosphate isomerase-like protein (cupin superfamily) [Deinobacterium chartae]|uniref:Mannose-6-phosphate isomerase-like protein (Cupin superfamily) n=1 Tax=Deinobacterium chartae TaxID=521158 RepID=A0A841I2D4_9DEIO|nr:cupin domain-containing protein [Deinobacterium chartae]MBB6098085.1 mannose-6-phosphate isomerase-like protein (cupin superfamily) [Deinobacterium chartae]